MLLNMCQGYPTAVARDQMNQIIGFGMLRPYSPFLTFSQTAEITYFLKPGFTGKGIGRTILEYLIAKWREKGISSVLASVSSLNKGSINFHLKNGFSECGRFRDIGRKRGKTFDVVYFQRMLWQAGGLERNHGPDDEERLSEVIPEMWASGILLPISFINHYLSHLQILVSLLAYFASHDDWLCCIFDEEKKKISIISKLRISRWTK